MNSLSVRFSRALAQGRAAPVSPTTRETLMVTLLKKRAIAQNMGAHELETMLRQQILWSLPYFGVSDRLTARQSQRIPS